MSSAVCVSAAASQSTLLVTPQQNITIFGYSVGLSIGVISPNTLLGKTISGISNTVSDLTVSLLHAGTPVAQDFFRQIKIPSVGGIRLFSTAVLGSTGSFTANSGGTFSIWVWKGTGVDSFPWTASDNNQQKTVSIFR